MTPTTDGSFPPVTRNNGKDNTGPVSSSQDGTSDVWAEAHAEVQSQLAVLEADVRRKVSGVRVSSGRTQGSRFFLFSYRTFSTQDSNLDPVVAGVTFMPAEQIVSVEADVSGEHTGDCIFPASSTTAGNSRDELLAAARESAQRLCRSADVVAAALADSSRGIE